MEFQSHNFLRIGELSRLTGKTVRTLRFYEEKGLLSPTDHTGGGFRLYRSEDGKRIQLIERLQELGFSLDRIRGLLQSWRRNGMGEGAAPALKDILEGSLKDTRDRIGRLARLERELLESLRFLEACGSCRDRPGRGRCEECGKGDPQAALPGLVEAMARE